MLNERKGAKRKMLNVVALQANLGNMDSSKEQWKMVGGNLALIQVRKRLRNMALCHIACAVNRTYWVKWKWAIGAGGLCDCTSKKSKKKQKKEEEEKKRPCSASTQWWQFFGWTCRKFRKGNTKRDPVSSLIRLSLLENVQDPRMTPKKGCRRHCVVTLFE